MKNDFTLYIHTSNRGNVPSLLNALLLHEFKD